MVRMKTGVRADLTENIRGMSLPMLGAHIAMCVGINCQVGIFLFSLGGREFESQGGLQTFLRKDFYVDANMNPTDFFQE